jgi:hypothetical protein
MARVARLVSFVPQDNAITTLLVICSSPHAVGLNKKNLIASIIFTGTFAIMDG